MFSRFRVAFAFVVMMSLIFAIPVFAGGWAVITLDELPSDLVAGQPYTIGFTVRQHGVTLMDGLYPVITANLNKETELSVDAKSDGKPGHYIATMIFPKDGEWSWSIQAFTMHQPMPALTVAAPSGVLIPKTEPLASSIPWLWIVRGLALVGVLVGGVLALRQRNRWAIGLTVACLVAGAASFITGAAVPAVEAQSVSSSNSSLSQVELGRQLFLAKGCITCHTNSRAKAPADAWTIQMGAPDLSKFSANSEVIFMRLKDPTSVKSDTKMPNLELHKDEIDALVAFLNSK
ncbi:MAG: c-type cytochrome [Anaerolineales bacterium]